MKTSDEPIIVEQTFNSSIEFVWDCLTEITQMRRWYFENIPAFKPEIGFQTQFGVESNNRIFMHTWKVTEVQPKKMIKYNWTFADYPGESSVAFKLLKQDNLTRLRLTVEVLQDFPDDVPEFKRESCIAGWIYFINNRLNDYLKNNLGADK